MIKLYGASASPFVRKVMGFSKEARKAKKELGALQAEADMEEARARIAKARGGAGE